MTLKEILLSRTGNINAPLVQIEVYLTPEKYARKTKKPVQSINPIRSTSEFNNQSNAPHPRGGRPSMVRRSLILFFPSFLSCFFNYVCSQTGFKFLSPSPSCPHGTAYRPRTVPDRFFCEPLSRTRCSFLMEDRITVRRRK